MQLRYKTGFTLQEIPPKKQGLALPREMQQGLELPIYKELVLETELH